MEPQHLDAWGLPIVPSDPPAADDELGYTCAEDGDWGPAEIRIATPVTRTLFALTFVYAGLSMVRTAVCRSGIHRRRPR